MIKDTISQRHKVVICVGSAAEAISMPTEIKRLLGEEYEEDMKAQVFTARGDDSVMSEQFRDFNASVQKADITIYTSKVSVGLDAIDPVDNVFVLPCVLAATPRDMYQMVSRCRNINNGQVFVAMRNTDICCNVKEIPQIEDCMENTKRRKQLLGKYHKMLVRDTAIVQAGGIRMQPSYLTSVSLCCRLESKVARVHWYPIFIKIILSRGQKANIFKKPKHVRKNKTVANTEYRKRVRSEITEMELEWYTNVHFALEKEREDERRVLIQVREATAFDKYVHEITFTNSLYTYEDGTVEPRAECPLSYDEYNLVTKHAAVTTRLGLLYLTKTAGKEYDYSIIQRTCYVENAIVHGKVVYDLFRILHRISPVCTKFTCKGSVYETEDIPRFHIVNNISLEEIQRLAIIATGARIMKKCQEEQLLLVHVLSGIMRSITAGSVLTRWKKMGGVRTPCHRIRIPMWAVQLAKRRTFVHRSIEKGILEPLRGQIQVIRRIWPFPD